MHGPLARLHSGEACTATGIVWLYQTAKVTWMAALLWGILALFADPTLAQTPAPGTTPNDKEGITAPKHVAAEPTTDDGVIAKRIQRILQSTGWFQNPRVVVQDGVVFIDGKTESQDHSRWASALAQSTEGVVAVVNRIAVEADVGSTFGLAGDEFLKIYRQATQAWPWALLAAAILLISWLLARVVAFFTRRFVANRISSSLLRTVAVRAFSIPVFILGIYFVLHVTGLTRLAITVLGGTGLFGIIIGFAFRDIAENFLASILLSVRNPFGTGDLIEVAGNTGIVQNLNIRSTVLLTLDGNHVQIPNATVFKSTIKNYSSTTSRRADFSVGISYDSPTTTAQTLIAKVLNQHPAVLKAPEPLVLVEELGAASVNLRIFYWFTSKTYHPAKTNSALLRLTKDALLKGGIELPDPAREVIFPRGVPIVHMDEASGATFGPPEVDRPSLDEDSTAATIGEGDLLNDSEEVSSRSEGKVPEGEENLLKR